jgi:hypothetical protein
MAAIRPILNRVPGGVSGRREPPAADKMRDLLKVWVPDSERLRESVVRVSRPGEAADQPGETGEEGDAGA